MNKKLIKYNNVNNIVKNKFHDFEFDMEYEDLPYFIAGDFARYIIKNITEENIKKINECFEFIEMLHLYGTKKTKELGTIGYLEGLQNYLLNDKLLDEYNLIENKYLGIESKKGWKALEDFWNGKSNYKEYNIITKFKIKCKIILNNIISKI
jgi:hypothetical protein